MGKISAHCLGCDASKPLPSRTTLNSLETSTYLHWNTLQNQHVIQDGLMGGVPSSRDVEITSGIYAHGSGFPFICLFWICKRLISRWDFLHFRNTPNLVCAFWRCKYETKMCNQKFFTRCTNCLHKHVSGEMSVQCIGQEKCVNKLVH